MFLYRVKYLSSHDSCQPITTLFIPSTPLFPVSVNDIARLYAPEIILQLSGMNAGGLSWCQDGEFNTIDF